MCLRMNLEVLMKMRKCVSPLTLLPKERENPEMEVVEGKE